MDPDEERRRRRIARPILAASGVFVLALASYSLLASVLWYPGRWVISVPIFVAAGFLFWFALSYDWLRRRTASWR